MFAKYFDCFIELIEWISLTDIRFEYRKRSIVETSVVSIAFSVEFISVFIGEQMAIFLSPNSLESLLHLPCLSFNWFLSPSSIYKYLEYVHSDCKPCTNYREYICAIVFKYRASVFSYWSFSRNGLSHKVGLINSSLSFGTASVGIISSRRWVVFSCACLIEMPVEWSPPVFSFVFCSSEIGSSPILGPKYEISISSSFTSHLKHLFNHSYSIEIRTSRIEISNRMGKF